MSIDLTKQVATFMMEVEMVETVMVNDDDDDRSEADSDLIVIDPTEDTEGENGTT